MLYKGAAIGGCGDGKDAQGWHPRFTDKENHSKYKNTTRAKFQKNTSSTEMSTTNVGYIAC